MSRVESGGEGMSPASTQPWDATSPLISSGSVSTAGLVKYVPAYGRGLSSEVPPSPNHFMIP